jgi:hypothetical protein
VSSLNSIANNPGDEWFVEGVLTIVCGDLLKEGFCDTSFELSAAELGLREILKICWQAKAPAPLI